MHLTGCQTFKSRFNHGYLKNSFLKDFFRMSHKIQIFNESLNVRQFQSSFDTFHLHVGSKEVNQLENKTFDVNTIFSPQNNSAEADSDLLKNENKLILKLKGISASCRLTEFPKTLFFIKYLTVLNLSNNSLESLPKEIGNLYNLVVLKLSSNELNTLPKSLKHLQQLNYLDISSNKFSEVPDVLYYGMRGLKVLDLSCNEITVFHDSPGCLTKLVELRLSSNSLKELPLWFFDNLCQLQFLNLNGNALCLDDVLFNYCRTGLFESLQVLSIENCNLTYEKIQILTLFKNLDALKIGNEKYFSAERKKKNYMGNLKMDIFKENCRKIKSLYLQNTGIGTLPSDFDCLKYLEELDLSDNLLSWLPDTFSDLVNLKILNLTSNQLFFLPTNIGRLVNLQQIHLGNNKLNEIPESFYNLKNLEFIDFYDNQIENIDPNMLKKKHLKGIDLELNYINVDFSDKIRVLYNCLKDSFRKHFCGAEKRCDIQNTKLNYSYDEKSSDSHSNGRSLESISSFEGETLSDPEDIFKDIEQKSYLEDDNWEGNVSNMEEEDAFFDPNELIKFDQLRDCRTNINNYCPANYHLPSVRETYLRNLTLALQNETVEDGQFDSD